LSEFAPATAVPISGTTQLANPQAEALGIIWTNASTPRTCPRRSYTAANSPLNAKYTQYLPGPGQNRAHSEQVRQKTSHIPCRFANSLVYAGFPNALRKALSSVTGVSVEIDSLPQIRTVVEGSEWRMSRALAHLKAKGGLEVPLTRKQARRHGPNSRPRPRCPRKGWRQHPMPYGPAFSAILCRSTKVPRKSSPTGHRSAEVIGSRRAGRNPLLRKPQLRRMGSNRRHRPRRAADRR